MLSLTLRKLISLVIHALSLHLLTLMGFILEDGCVRHSKGTRGFAVHHLVFAHHHTRTPLPTSSIPMSSTAPREPFEVEFMEIEHESSTRMYPDRVDRRSESVP